MPPCLTGHAHLWVAGPVLWGIMPKVHAKENILARNFALRPKTRHEYEFSPTPARVLRAAAHRGLAGPDTSGSSSSGSDDDDAEQQEELEGSSSSGGSEGDGSGSEDDEDEEEEEGGFQGRQLRPALPGEVVEEEGLEEADLLEWGVGALAANPEEQVRRASCSGTDGSWVERMATLHMVGRGAGARRQPALGRLPRPTKPRPPPPPADPAAT